VVHVDRALAANGRWVDELEGNRMLMDPAFEMNTSTVGEQPPLLHHHVSTALIFRMWTALLDEVSPRRAGRGQIAQRTRGRFHQLFVRIDPHQPIAAGAGERLVPGSAEVVAPIEVEDLCPRGAREVLSAVARAGIDDDYFVDRPGE